MVSVVVDLTGDYKSNIYSAARRLIAAGADPAGLIEVWRDGEFSMSGNIGELAKLTVVENKHGNPALQLVVWRPFPTNAVGSRTAENGSGATKRQCFTNQKGFNMKTIEIDEENAKHIAAILHELWNDQKDPYMELRMNGDDTTEHVFVRMQAVNRWTRANGFGGALDDTEELLEEMGCPEEVTTV